MTGHPFPATPIPPPPRRPAAERPRLAPLAAAGRPCHSAADERPRHRRHRLHRRAARAPAAGRGTSRALHGARPVAAGRAAVAGRGGRGGRRAGSRLARPGAGRHGRRLLPDPLAGGGRAGLRGARPRARPGTSATPRCAPACDRSSTSAASGRRQPELSRHLRSRQETGEALARDRRAGDGVPRRGHRRLGQPLVRDDPLPGRARAGDDHAALGAHALPAHRRARRARLPRRRARPRPRRSGASSRSADRRSSPTAT